MPSIVAGPRVEVGGRAIKVTVAVAQWMLALGFGIVGSFEVISPLHELHAVMPWVGALTPGAVRLLGVTELAGALALALPPLFRVKTAFVSIAAACLGIVMALAFGFHAARDEYAMLPITFAVLVLASFVAWGTHRDGELR